MDCLSLVQKHMSLLMSHNAPFASSSEIILLEGAVENSGELDKHG